MEHKVLTDQIKEEKIEKNESVSYRLNAGKERRNPVKTGGKLLTLTIFYLELCCLHQKLRFEKPE